MYDLKLLVPTYYGDTADKPCFAGKEEFDEPSVPVLIREAEGVRVVLGAHDYNDTDKPDIQIERRPNGWAIFLHPMGGGDPSGLIYFLDDGRSFLVPEYLPSASIEVLDRVEQVPLIDDPPIIDESPGPDLVPKHAPNASNELVAPPSQGMTTAATKLKEALIQARTALAGDSNDAEHEALLALVEALDDYELIDQGTADSFVCVPWQQNQRRLIDLPRRMDLHSAHHHVRGEVEGHDAGAAGSAAGA